MTISLALKKGLGCTHAIQTVRNIVNQYIKVGYIANLCAIDLSKAFDKINLHALFIKLMKRQIPNKLLIILENWLCGSYACVKWDNLWSDMFTINLCGRVLSCNQCSLQSTLMMCQSVANYILVFM